MLTASTRKPKIRHDSSEVISSFILKSYQLLDDQKFTDIVDWNEEGTAIVIKKPLEFGNVVLPTYFKHGNVASFTRQLNMYSFRKRRNQAYDLVYYHEQFQRGQKNLLKNVRRKTHDNSLVSIRKALTAIQNKQSEQQSETATTDSDEAETLRNFNKTAVDRISSLEKTMEELIAQNRDLKLQVRQQSKRETLFVSFMSNVMEKTGTTKEHLHEILEAQFTSLPLNSNEDAPASRTTDFSFLSRAVGASMNNNTTLNMEDYIVSDSIKSTNITSHPSEHNFGSEFGASEPEGMRYESGCWRLQPERGSGEDQLIRRSFGSYDDEFEGPKKMLKTEEFLNIKRVSSCLSWSKFLGETQEFPSLKIEDNNNDIGIHSNMNDLMRGDLGLLRLD